MANDIEKIVGKAPKRESDVQKMTGREYEANEEAITASIRNGTFIYDISGAAM